MGSVVSRLCASAILAMSARPQHAGFLRCAHGRHAPDNGSLAPALDTLANVSQLLRPVLPNVGQTLVGEVEGDAIVWRLAEGVRDVLAAERDGGQRCGGAPDGGRAT